MKGGSVLSVCRFEWFEVSLSDKINVISFCFFLIFFRICSSVSGRE